MTVEGRYTDTTAELLEVGVLMSPGAEVARRALAGLIDSEEVTHGSYPDPILEYFN